jgi:hypothetical protein
MEAHPPQATKRARIDIAVIWEISNSKAKAKRFGTVTTFPISNHKTFGADH